MKKMKKVSGNPAKRAEQMKAMMNNYKELNVRMFDWERTSDSSDDIMENYLLERVCKEENFTGDLPWIRVRANDRTALLVSFDNHNEARLRQFADCLVNNRVMTDKPKFFLIALQTQNPSTKKGVANVFIKSFGDFGRIALNQ